MKRKIKKETLDKAIRTTFRFWKSNFTSMPSRIDLLIELSSQAFGTGVVYSFFENILNSAALLKIRLRQKITYETVYKTFETLGFEIIDGEIYQQTALAIPV